MNKLRRAKIKDIALKLDEINQDISALKEAEEEALEALPESFQDSEQGDLAQGAIEDFESAIQYIDDAISSLSDASGD